MAQPIPLDIPPHDPRKELNDRLEKAPIEHAEALLDAYKLLQQLHDQHVFEILRGALGAGGKFVESAVNLADAPGSVRAIRNAIVLSKMLGAIDPAVLQCVAAAMRETLGSDRNSVPQEPPGMLSLFNLLRQPEVRRSVGLISRFLDVFGRELKDHTQGRAIP